MLEHFEYVEKRWGIPPTLDAVVIGHRTYAGRWVRGCHTTAIGERLIRLNLDFCGYPKRGSARYACGPSTENGDVFPLRTRCGFARRYDVVAWNYRTLVPGFYILNRTRATIERDATAGAIPSHRGFASWPPGRLLAIMVCMVVLRHRLAEKKKSWLKVGKQSFASWTCCCSVRPQHPIEKQP